MRIAVFGSGGVGGYFGGRLAQAGADVTFIARGAHLDALRAHGLYLHSTLGDAHIAPVTATDKPEDVGPVDIVLYAVKMYHVEETAPQLAPLLGEETAVVCLQNGVEAERLVAALYGEAHVMGGVAYIEAAIGEPGHIHHGSPFARVLFGELDGRISRRAQRLLSSFQAAPGVTAELSDRIWTHKWEKFLFICALSGLTAAAQTPVGPLLQVPQGRQVAEAIMREVAALAAAEGVSLPPNAVAQALSRFESLPPSMKSSLQRDFEHRRPTETQWLNGAVVRLAERHGLPVPHNRVIYAVLAARERALSSSD